MGHLEYFGYAQTALTVWALVHAYRRGVDPFWYYLIIFIPVLGAWAYFFLVMVPSWLGGVSFSLPQRGPSAAELRQRVQLSATPANHLEFAERLVHDREYAEAIGHLETVLAREPDHRRALFYLAKCHAQTDQSDKAIVLLEKLIAADRFWGDYAAWYLLIERKAVNDAEGALKVCQELARLTPILKHQCLLAEHLLALGKKEEAAGVLERALQEHRLSAGNVKWRNWRWAIHARRLQRQATVPNS